MTPIERMEQLGHAGITVSICCGPSGIGLFAWSVQCLAQTGEEFDAPFMANDFEHAVDIAENEVRKRGWLDAGNDTRDWEER